MADPQMQSNLERMKAAALAKKNRGGGGMVMATATSSKPTTSTPTATRNLLASPTLHNSSSAMISSPVTSIGGMTPTFPIQQDETKGQEKLRKTLERVGIAPTVDTAGEAVPRRLEPRQEVAKLDITDTRSFLGQPPPKVGMIQCYIVREKGGNKYNLFLEEQNIFLLSSVKRKQNKTSNYLISLDREDLNRDSGHFYGKLRANFVGTEFTIFDKGEKPTPQGNVQGVSLRQEIGAVIYERNILGTKGPRKMCGLVPFVDDQGKRTPWKPETEEDGLTANLKKGNTRDMLILRNKEPSWNEQLRAYVLNFSGRVTMASVKNFQLVDQDNPSKVLMQFGKVDSNKFTLDFQFPICGLQAFGIALSAFDSKLACE